MAVDATSLAIPDRPSAKSKIRSLRNGSSSMVPLGVGQNTTLDLGRFARTTKAPSYREVVALVHVTAHGSEPQRLKRQLATAVCRSSNSCSVLPPCSPSSASTSLPRAEGRIIKHTRLPRLPNTDAFSGNTTRVSPKKLPRACPPPPPPLAHEELLISQYVRTGRDIFEAIEGSTRQTRTQSQTRLGLPVVSSCKLLVLEQKAENGEVDFELQGVHPSHPSGPRNTSLQSICDHGVARSDTKSIECCMPLVGSCDDKTGESSIEVSRSNQTTGKSRACSVDALCSPSTFTKINGAEDAALDQTFKRHVTFGARHEIIPPTIAEEGELNKPAALEDAVGALRMHLIVRFGSPSAAFKALDLNDNGFLSMSELETSLCRYGIPWREVTKCTKFGKVFFALDKSHFGKLSLQDMMGQRISSSSEIDESLREVDDGWAFLSTSEKWTKWCDLTPEVPPEQRSRQPHWSPTLDTNKQLSGLEARRDDDRERMRLMISQGIHKTPAGLKMTLDNLPLRLDETGARNLRHELLDSVDAQSKRIRRTLGEVSNNRSVLKQCSRAMRAIDSATRVRHLHESIDDSHKKVEHLCIDKVHMFTEENLSVQEREVRNTARRLEIPIPDAEAIHAQFHAFDRNGSGFINREEFPRMLRSLLGSSMQLNEVWINELWRRVDTDRDHKICFPEYLVWHYDTFGSPFLSIIAPVDVEVSESNTCAQTLIRSEPGAPNRSRIVSCPV